MWLISVDAMSIACPVTSALALLTLAVPFTLCAEVVAEHGSEDEVLFGRQLIERTRNEQTDGIETFAATEIDVHVLFASGLHHIVYRLAAQTMAGLLLETAVAGEEYHSTHTFLIFIDVIHQCTLMASQPNFWAIFSAIASHVPVEEP